MTRVVLCLCKYLLVDRCKREQSIFTRYCLLSWKKKNVLTFVKGLHFEWRIYALCQGSTDFQKFRNHLKILGVMKAKLMEFFYSGKEKYHTPAYKTTSTASLNICINQQTLRGSGSLSQLLVLVRVFGRWAARISARTSSVWWTRCAVTQFLHFKFG